MRLHWSRGCPLCFKYGVFSFLVESRAKGTEDPVLHRGTQRERGAPGEVRVVCGVVAVEREQVRCELSDARERRHVDERMRRRSDALVVLGSCGLRRSSIVTFCVFNINLL